MHLRAISMHSWMSTLMSTTVLFWLWCAGVSVQECERVQAGQ